MMKSTCNENAPVFSRRQLLQQMGGGFGGLALAGLLAEESAAALPHDPLAAKPSHFVGKAKRVIMLFMFGGPSHIDSFDPKPVLTRDSGKPLPFGGPRVLSFPKRHGNLVGTPFRFRQHGESGASVSEVFPHVADISDELCFINSMHCSNSRHGGAVPEWHTGSDTFVRPSLGSWISYGLGSENRNLPGYVTICQALTEGSTNNFGSAFLPATYQGTPIGHSGVAVKDAKIPFISGNNPRNLQKLELEMIRKLGRQQLERIGEDDRLDARIASFEQAFRMQMAAPEVQNISDETQATRRLYGLDEKETEDFGLQCLLARRFSERGVRFVQCNSNGWDHHSSLEKSMRSMCRSVDQPIAGLIRDLKQRGLLNETLVVWGGEFGRTPVAENANGRDHNPHGFTMWMAGGGIKPGMTYGHTDDYGYYAVENKVHFHDLHATILHSLGLDHESLSYRYAGRDFRLTDIYGEVVHDILA